MDRTPGDGHVDFATLFADGAMQTYCTDQCEALSGSDTPSIVGSILGLAAYGGPGGAEEGLFGAIAKRFDEGLPGALARTSLGDVIIRANYNDALSAVRDASAQRLANGEDKTLVAYDAWALRRALGVVGKDQTSLSELQRIIDRNIERYQDPLGPSWERTVADCEGDYDCVIAKATRSGGDDLGYTGNQPHPPVVPTPPNQGRG